jgi:hypothetical protein
MSVFQVFPCTTQIAIFWPKLLPALFLKQPCPLEILAEALHLMLQNYGKPQYLLFRLRDEIQCIHQLN